MTFNDLYQGLTKEDIPSLRDVNNANASANNDNDITDSSPLFAKDDQLDEHRNLFSSRPESKLGGLHLTILLGRPHPRFQGTYVGDGRHTGPTAKALMDAIKVTSCIVIEIGNR